MKYISWSSCIYVLWNEILPWKERKKAGSDGGHTHEWCVFLCLSCWPGHRCPEARQRSRGERWILVYLHTLVFPHSLPASSWNKSIFSTDQFPTLADFNQRFFILFEYTQSSSALIWAPLLPFWICSPYIFNKLEVKQQHFLTGNLL